MRGGIWSWKKKMTEWFEAIIELEPIVNWLLTIIAISVSGFAYAESRKKRLFEEKEMRKIKLVKEIEMYTDIAKFNHWNWLPGDVDFRDPDYERWNNEVDKFVSYKGLVDPEIRSDYDFIVEKFRGYCGNSEKPELMKKINKVRKFAKKKVEELRKELDSLN